MGSLVLASGLSVFLCPAVDDSADAGVLWHSDPWDPGLCDWPHVGRRHTNSLCVRGAEQGPRSLSSQPIEPSLRIYERRAKHFEERRPCLQPGHGPRGARGEWGAGGREHARGARRPRDGWPKKRMQETPGSKVFLGTEKKAEKGVLFLTGVCTCTMPARFPEMGRGGPSQPQNGRVKVTSRSSVSPPTPPRTHQQLNNIVTKPEMAILQISLLLGGSWL